MNKKEIEDKMAKKKFYNVLDGYEPVDNDDGSHSIKLPVQMTIGVEDAITVDLGVTFNRVVTLFRPRELSQFVEVEGLGTRDSNTRIVVSVKNKSGDLMFLEPGEVIVKVIVH